MTVMTTAAAVGPEAAFPLEALESHTARFDLRWGRSGAVISVHGEVDAANAGLLGEYVEHYAGCCEWLVLDLSGLDFIGTAALSVLQSVQDCCTTVGVTWALVPGPAVSRVLRLCGHDCALPIDESLADALAAVQHSSHRLQLVET